MIVMLTGLGNFPATPGVLLHSEAKAFLERLSL